MNIEMKIAVPHSPSRWKKGVGGAAAARQGGAKLGNQVASSTINCENSIKISIAL